MRLLNRNPPRDRSSHSPIASRPENRMHAEHFTAVRFSRRLSLPDAACGAAAELALRRSAVRRSVSGASLFSRLDSRRSPTLRSVNFHTVEELPHLQWRVKDWLV